MDKNERLDMWFDVLMEQDVSNEELCAIIGNIREVQKRAWHELLQRDPNCEDLSSVIITTKSDKVRHEAVEKFFEKEPSKDDLIHILINVKGPLVEQLWRRLKDKELTNVDLYCIISHTRDEIRKEAWGMLTARNPDEDDLHYVFPDTEL